MKHRTSQRAIANNSDSYDGGDHLSSSSTSAQNPTAVVNNMVEVENGVITYTVNLLGNCPRIMDVCIPKLLEDGRVCLGKSYLLREHISCTKPIKIVSLSNQIRGWCYNTELFLLLNTISIS